MKFDIDFPASLQQVFDACQDGCTADLLQSIKNISKAVEPDEFWNKFCEYLRCYLAIGENHAVVDNGLEFVAKFATSNEETDQETPLEDSLLIKLFLYLIKHHEAQSAAVRARVCQTVGLLLENLSSDEVIDDELFAKLRKAMLKRMKDKTASVRVQAAFALRPLQDPSNEDCPVVSAYLFHVERDPKADVRKAVLACVAAVKRTLFAVVGRTRDTEASVRVAAFKFLASKVHYRCLSIAERVQLLTDGLRDRADAVRKVVQRNLLPAWVKWCDNCPLTLLNVLDVENSSDVAQLALKSYFESMAGADLVANFAVSLEPGRFVPLAEVTCAKAFYWRCLAQHFHALGPEADDHLEALLPDLPPLCDYIQRYVDEFTTGELHQLLEKEFIVHQLVLLTGLHGTDESGMKEILRLIQRLLMSDTVSVRLVDPLVERLSLTLTIQDTIVSFLMEVIDEIRVPITETEAAAAEPTEEDVRCRDLKLAKIRVQINEIREQMVEAGDAQDFARAAELKERLVELETERESVASEPAPVAPAEATVLARNDPDTLVKCLSVAVAMLRLEEVKTLSSGLQSLVETLVLPGIPNEDNTVRAHAVQALGLACLLSQDLAVQHVVLLLEVLQVDEEPARVMAARVVLDILLVFGVDAFDSSSATDCSGSDLSVSGERDCGGGEAPYLDIIKRLVEPLDTETNNVRAVLVEGLGKLLFANRFRSPKLLSRFVLMWYNPVTEDDSYLRHFLSVFLPAYAATSRDHRENVEEAFLPTLHTLFEAPPSSPLSKIDANNVAKFLVELTRARNPVGPAERSKSAMSVHDGLALRLCNEVLSDPKSSFCVHVLVRALALLDLSTANETTVKDLYHLSQTMTKKVTDPTCVKFVLKFHVAVSDLRDQLETSAVAAARGEIAGTPLRSRGSGRIGVSETPRTLPHHHRPAKLLRVPEETVLMSDGDEPEK